MKSLLLPLELLVPCEAPMLSRSFISPVGPAGAPLNVVSDPLDWTGSLPGIP